MLPSETIGRPEDAELRAQLSSLQSLLVLSMVMTESRDAGHILQLATTSIRALAVCDLRGAHLVEGGWQGAAGPCTDPDIRSDLEAQFAVLSDAGGAVAIRGDAWSWAFPLRSLAGHFGHLVVGADIQPTTASQFLLRVLAQQTGIALANARLHARERAAVADLQTANAQLAESVDASSRKSAIHVRLTRAAAAGEGIAGIATAVAELTGYPIAVEDRQGNLQAWAGAERPRPYPRDSPTTRERLLRRAADEGGPIREADRLIVVANPRADIVGVIVLFDPDQSAGEEEKIALEHGATVLAMELAQLSTLAETELRRKGDLVDELLTGPDEPSAIVRARSLGFDLERPHRVAIVDGGEAGDRDDEAFFHNVRRAASERSPGVLTASRGSSVILVADAETDWEPIRAAIVRGMPRGRYVIGVGGVSSRAQEAQRSYREARLALKLQGSPTNGGSVIAFERLGVYRLLGEIEDVDAIERFARDWLGSLIDYDQRRHAELVATLSSYLEHGRSHETTSEAMNIHRSTLKYRLQRIRDVSGHDLSDPDVGFNLQLASRAWRTLGDMREAH